MADCDNDQECEKNVPTPIKPEPLPKQCSGGGESGEGTNDFNELENRPKYGGRAMTGDTNIPEVETYEDFVGTDGEEGGTAGLVPAPKTTDAGKFLKADGTWSNAGGSGDSVITLTSADYNYPIDNPTRVSLWDKESGFYTWANGVRVAFSTSSSTTQEGSALVFNPEGYYTDMVQVYPAGEASTYTMWKTVRETGVASSGYSNTHPITTSNIVQSTGTSAANIMSQKAVTDALNALPTGGGMVELTSADYNYHSSGDTDDGVAIWLLEPGAYKWGAQLKTYTSSAPTSRNYWKDSFLFVIAKGGNAIYFDTSTGFYYSVYMGGDGSSYIQNMVLDENKLKQSAGASSTDVMSQNAVTSMVYADPSIRRSVRIGNNKTTGTYSLNIGYSSGSATGDVSGMHSVGIGDEATINTGSDYSVAIGSNSQIGNHKDGVVALGAYSGSNITAAGMMDIGSSNTTYGYNSTNYRLLSGVHDPVGAHDAATKGYVDANAGGPTVVQTTGTSTTDVMSQNGVSTILFRDPASMKQVQVGNGAGASGTNGATAVGYYSYATGDLSTAIGGFAAEAEGAGAVAIGTLSRASTKGEFNIGLPKANSTQQANFGYNGTAYRLLSGVHDGQGANDAVTVGQVNSVIDAINTALSINIPHIGA